MAPIRIKQSPASSAQTLASSHDPRLLVRETICISANLASAPSYSSSSSIAIENSGLWPELRLGLVEEQFLYSSLRVICWEEIDGRRWKYVAQKDSLGRFKKGSIRAVSLQTPQPPGKTKSGRPYVLFPPAARRMDTLDDLLATNNLISLHYALSNETAQNINADCLQHIKPEAFLVNTGSLLQIRKWLLKMLKNLLKRKGPLLVLKLKKPEQQCRDLKRPLKNKSGCPKVLGNRMAFEEHGLNQDVLTILSQFIGGTTSEIQERYNSLKEKYQEKHTNNSELSGETKSERSILSNKSLSAALDSFDNLFCRRCLVFDCRLHGCSQTLITPSEKQSYWCDPEEDGRPCSDQCYLRVLAGVKDLTECPDTSALHGKSAAALAVNDGSPVLSGHIHGTSITPEESFSEGMTGDNPPEVTDSPEVTVGTLGKRKVLKLSSISMGSPTPVSDDLHGSAGKKQKKTSVSDLVPLDFEGLSVLDGAPDEDELQLMSEHLPNKSIEQTSETHIFPGNIPHNKNEENIKDHGGEVAIKEQERKQSSNSKKEYVEGTLIGCEWKPIEKELYLKGIEIFGRNSCLIARNLLSGLKTCLEVSSYMHDDGASLPNKSAALPSSFQEDPGKADMDFMEQEMPVRSRIFRRRGRTRKLKYSWKSAGHPSFRKRIADGKHQSCKQYTPCGCQYMCGKDCTCLHNGTCCEKYCGCSKSCKNRFRGCHCAKSQCRSRQCPCFAAGRECDPDVCRNCWVTCGDGSLGEPPERGDSYQCGNMRLFLKQQQRILLARSEVAGWGAFIKNPVNKNDYLGEYTGELISHREADKRGKIYDRANSSFLFDLNDQYVLDAYRKGDKLKFANHSSNPNCYAKVMLVAGDHRVGIFAKEHIEASEELFYDYRYGPDQAPLWARRPEGSKRDDSLVSHGRAQKHQSH